MEAHTILFDLDGTLTDPGEGITKSVAYALASFGITVQDRRTLYPFIGPPLVESFMGFYGFTAEQAKQAVEKYREYFSQQGIFENTPYPGIHQALAQLKGQGKRLLLATSKPTVFARQILERFDLLPYFDFVGGSDLEGKRGQKGQVIAYTMEQAGVRRAGAWDGGRPETRRAGGQRKRFAVRRRAVWLWQPGGTGGGGSCGLAGDCAHVRPVLWRAYDG